MENTIKNERFAYRKIIGDRVTIFKMKNNKKILFLVLQAPMTEYHLLQ